MPPDTFNLSKTRENIQASSCLFSLLQCSMFRLMSMNRLKLLSPSSNAEKITHGIFYTAITRAKEQLKIFWSSETMQEVVSGFYEDNSRQRSLAIIKEKIN